MSLMTLDEAIQHCRDKENCSQCGQEHKQLREWLEELKELRSQYNLPTPHGDLIDRDHLLSLIEGWNEDVENDKQNENSFVVGKTLNGVIRIIRGAHAVIEAEEEQ